MQQPIVSALPVWFLVGVMGVFASLAQEGLGPMGGVGGEMRRIESQAQAPMLPSVQAVRPAMTVKPPAAPAAEVAAVGADAGLAWDIQAVTLSGDFSFAQKMGVKKMLEAALLGGAPRSRDAVQEALRDVFKMFIAKGYYLARVSLARSPYDASSKTLSVLVEAGLLGEVKLAFTNDALSAASQPEGRWFGRKQLLRKLAGLETGQPFNYQALYDDVSEINAHPDLTVDSRISVRKVLEGEGDDRRVVRYADLDFTVKESRPFHAVFDVNNYATESINEWQAALTLQYLNLTKADDVLTLSPSMALDSSLLSLAGSYMRPHHAWKGGATTVYGGWSDLDSQDIVPNIDLLGTGYFMGLVRSYTLVEDEDRLISLSGGLVYRYIEDQFAAFGTALQQRDVTVLPLSIALSYSARKPDGWRGRNFATVQTVYNLMAGGSSSLEDMWVGAEDNYMIARLQYARLQPLFGTLDSMKRRIHQWILFLKAEGQYASCPLIPAEKLSLGGYNTLRGYTTKGYLGDNGIYGTVELRTPILLDMISNAFGRKATGTPIDRLQFIAFMDYGFLQYIDPLPGVDESEMLLSGGGGLRLAMTQYSQLRLDIGVPMAAASGDDTAEYYVDWQVQF